MRHFFLRLVMPITRLIGKIAKPLPTMSADFLYYIMDKVQPGDVLLSGASLNLSNLFIPGKFTHAAMFCGDCIVEAIGDGVVKSDFTEWIMQHDCVALLRFKKGDNTRGEKLSKIAKEQIGKGYDFLFEKDLERFYCSELVCYCYEQIYGEGVLGEFDLIEPMDLYNNSDFEVIAEC